FKPKTLGWGVYPVTWQGWVWTGSWAAVMLLPFFGFISQHDMTVEALIWLAASISVMLLDVWQVLRAMNPPAVRPAPARPAPRPPPRRPPTKPTPPLADEGITFLGEPQTRPVGTRNYDFRVRK